MAIQLAFYMIFKHRTHSVTLISCLKSYSIGLYLFIDDQFTPYLNTVDRQSDPKAEIFHIPVLYGDDFNYKNASHNFEFMDTMNELLKARSNPVFKIPIRTEYANADEYLERQYQESMHKSFPVFEGDFMNYVQREERNNILRVDFWTGFYTTKPVMK